MGHHYVPQYYLRGFAVGSSIWVYDKQAKKQYQTQVKSTANETDLYSPEVEAFFAEQVENLANPVLEKLRQHKSPDPAERRALARYLAYFWQRVPRGRERAMAQVPKVAEEIRAEIIEGLELAAKEQPELTEQVRALKERVSEIIERHKAKPSPDIWRQAMLLHQNPRIVAAVASMSWKFVVTDSHQFLTSDNPMFFYEHEGVGRPQSEVSFPVSSTVALIASNQRRDLDGTFFRVRPEVVKKLNRRTAHNTQRFAYAKKDEHWVLPFLLKDHGELPRLG